MPERTSRVDSNCASILFALRVRSVTFGEATVLKVLEKTERFTSSSHFTLLKNHTKRSDQEGENLVFERNYGPKDCRFDTQAGRSAIYGLYRHLLP